MQPLKGQRPGCLAKETIGNASIARSSLAARDISTKERRPFFQNSKFREEMFRMLAHHVKEATCVSASVGGYVDHVHLLVGLSRTITIAK